MADSKTRQLLAANALPTRRIGFIWPAPVLDVAPYEFYRIAPPPTMMVTVGVSLGEFSEAEAERVIEPFESLTRQLVDRGADVVVQSGVPLSVLIGPHKLGRLLERIERAGGVPALSTVLCVVDNARELGIRSIAFGNKWTKPMNRSLAGFFAQAGIAVTGVQTRSMTPAEFMKMGTDDSASAAYELGRSAFEANPGADALYLGGGAWLSIAAVLRLEAEFGKPVITNSGSAVRAACKRVGCWEPRVDCGTVVGLA